MVNTAVFNKDLKLLHFKAICSSTKKALEFRQMQLYLDLIKF